MNYYLTEASQKILLSILSSISMNANCVFFKTNVQDSKGNCFCEEKKFVIRSTIRLSKIMSQKDAEFGEEMCQQTSS